MKSSLVFALIAAAVGGVVQAHPNPACGVLADVSSHGVVVASPTNATAFSSPKGAGIDDDLLVIYHVGEQGLHAVYGTSPQDPEFTDAGYWNMDSEFTQRAPFVVAAGSDEGTGLISANENNIVVTYAVNGSVKSKRFLGTSSTSEEQDVELVRGNYSDLFSGAAAFVFATVDADGEVSVKQSVDAGVTWTLVNTEAIEDAASAQISGQIKSDGSILLAYHTVEDGIKVFDSATGETYDLPIFGTWVSLAVTRNAPFLEVRAVANLNGTLTSTTSTNGGTEWTPAVIVTSDVNPNGQVSLISTKTLWVVAYQNQLHDKIAFHASSSEDAGAQASWSTTESLFSGNVALGRTFGEASFASTGGNGWIMAVISEETGSVNARACFDAPQSNKPPTTVDDGENPDDKPTTPPQAADSSANKRTSPPSLSVLFATLAGGMYMLMA